MLAVGIDLKSCPLPIGPALERICKILPSHEAVHDPLLRGEPWFRKVAFPTIPSEGNAPWAGTTRRDAPKLPAGPPPGYEMGSSAKDCPPVLVVHMAHTKMLIAIRPTRTVLRLLQMPSKGRRRTAQKIARFCMASQRLELQSCRTQRIGHTHC